MPLNLLLELLYFMQQNFNPFQPSVAFHLETSRLTCTTNQMTGFYMKYNTGLKWVNEAN